MRFSRRKSLPTAALIVALGLTTYAWANPGVAVCAFLRAEPTRLDGIEAPVEQIEQLVSDARMRIQNMFGSPLAHPKIVFWDSPGSVAKLGLNTYASTHFLGTRACVIIGPMGRSVDVVAHELMHAEVFERVGPWARMTQLPVWFDEGLAMQVDFREKYDLGKDADTANIRGATGARHFFVQGDLELTRNYALAKREVSQWVNAVGSSSVYAQLARIRSGEQFQNVVFAK